MSGDDSGLQGGVLTADWEVDLWGRVRYGRAASARASRVGAGRLRVRAPVDCGAGGEELVPGHGSGLQAEAARDTIRAERGAGAAGRRRARASASATMRMSSSRAPTSAAIAMPCARSSLPANRRSVRSSSCSAAIRRPRRPSRRSCRRSRARCRPGCPPNCSSGVPTSSPPSGASPRRSTGLARPRRRGCRRSR